MSLSWSEMVGVVVLMQNLQRRHTRFFGHATSEDKKGEINNYLTISFFVSPSAVCRKYMPAGRLETSI
jgi:hypothetical protein